MKRSALLSTTLQLLFFSICLRPSVVICQGDEPGSEVLLGQIDGATMRIKFTGGILFNDAGPQSFQRYDVASKRLQAAGVSQEAIDELEQQLKQSVTWLEKKKKPKSGGRNWAKGAARNAKAELVSMVEVKRAAFKSGVRHVYDFRVFTGVDVHTILTAGNGDEPCEHLNDKCFICPDGRIRCLTAAIKGEREWWRRSYRGKGDNEDE